MFKKAAVELLILKKDDFERVLKASMQKQWDDISSALKQFPYFEDWNEVATRECCMLSDTMSYNTHDIILGMYSRAVVITYCCSQGGGGLRINSSNLGVLEEISADTGDRISRGGERDGRPGCQFRISEERPGLS